LQESSRSSCSASPHSSTSWALRCVAAWRPPAKPCAVAAWVCNAVTSSHQPDPRCWRRKFGARCVWARVLGTPCCLAHEHFLLSNSTLCTPLCCCHQVHEFLLGTSALSLLTTPPVVQLVTARLTH
jgi:hypothetical protein